MLATAGPDTWLLVTQFTPVTMPVNEPEPEQLSTLTATRRVVFATPYWLPPMVPATWVPWPWQSVLLPSPTVLVPQTARPPNVVCVVRMPVSMTYPVTVLVTSG